MSFLQSLGFGAKSGSVVGIDIGSSAIKLVQVRRDHGKAVLETYGTIALGPYVKLGVGQATNSSTEEVVKALKDLFKEANVTTKKAALSIPLRSSLVKVIEFPTIEQSKLNQMIPLEARKYIPVPISEVALDWWVIPNQTYHGVEDAPEAEQGEPGALKDKTEVLVVAIHNGTIKKFQDIATGSDLNLGTFEVETFSGVRSIIDRDITTTAILDIGAATTKLTIVDFGIVKVAHTINKGSQDITTALASSVGITFEQAEDIKRRDGLIGVESRLGISNKTPEAAMGTMSTILDFIFHETNRVIVDYERRYARLVTRVVLVGGGSTMKGLLPAAQKVFQTDVMLGDPFRHLESPAFLGDVLKTTGPEFYVAIGLAIRELGNLGGL